MFACLAGAILVVLAAWVFGSVIARIAGGFLATLGLVGMLMTGVAHRGLGEGISALVVFLMGFALWLAGHWIFAFKHHGWRSPLARRFNAQAPHHLPSPRLGSHSQTKHVRSALDV